DAANADRLGTGSDSILMDFGLLDPGKVLFGAFEVTFAKGDLCKAKRPVVPAERVLPEPARAGVHNLVEEEELRKGDRNEVSRAVELLEWDYDVLIVLAHDAAAGIVMQRLAAILDIAVPLCLLVVVRDHRPGLRVLEPAIDVCGGACLDGAVAQRIELK